MGFFLNAYIHCHYYRGHYFYDTPVAISCWLYPFPYYRGHYFYDTPVTTSCCPYIHCHIMWTLFLRDTCGYILLVISIAMLPWTLVLGHTSDYILLARRDVHFFKYSRSLLRINIYVKEQNQAHDIFLKWFPVRTC